MSFDVKNYIVDDNIKITITNNYIYIYNYGKIIDISDTIIKLLYKTKEIKIYGESMMIKKLDKKEMFVIGIFKKVEL